MIFSDLIKTLSQATGGMQKQTLTPMAQQMRKRYQARSPWGQKVIDRQKALTGDMLKRMREKELAQWKYSKGMQTYKSQLADYTERRRALSKSDSSLSGDMATLFGDARERYIAARVGERPTAPEKYKPSTAYKKMRYKKPSRTTTRRIQPTTNRARFLRGVKFE